MMCGRCNLVIEKVGSARGIMIFRADVDYSSPNP
jgi:hypothetical protein